jgi:hypothetical protein
VSDSGIVWPPVLTAKCSGLSVSSLEALTAGQLAAEGVFDSFILACWVFLKISVACRASNRRSPLDALGGTGRLCAGVASGDHGKVLPTPGTNSSTSYLLDPPCHCETEASRSTEEVESAGRAYFGSCGSLAAAVCGAETASEYSS